MHPTGPPLPGLSVRELTGDMQLSKKELSETQMIVTTPEKWDVITRKGGEATAAASVRLLIIDEVHLLNDERGPVIETLVARTTRQVEASQSMIRIVGLSATLPNYRDVARFLGVAEAGEGARRRSAPRPSPPVQCASQACLCTARVGANTVHATRLPPPLAAGVFYFDASYRPVPLETRFVGVSERNVLARMGVMDEVAYQKVVESLKRGHQAMIFVHRWAGGRAGKWAGRRLGTRGGTRPPPMAWCGCCCCNTPPLAPFSMQPQGHRQDGAHAGAQGSAGGGVGVL